MDTSNATDVLQLFPNHQRLCRGALHEDVDLLPHRVEGCVQNDYREDERADRVHDLPLWIVPYNGRSNHDANALDSIANNVDQRGVNIAAPALARGFLFLLVAVVVAVAVTVSMSVSFFVVIVIVMISVPVRVTVASAFLLLVRMVTVSRSLSQPVAAPARTPASFDPLNRLLHVVGVDVLLAILGSVSVRVPVASVGVPVGVGDPAEQVGHGDVDQQSQRCNDEHNLSVDIPRSDHPPNSLDN
mmetsp:Transcript_30859/g.75250  ORF Transcript_30859/g.75250 Transcript_30859/m.75250 type:complete len:244 (+) Transcript_30859:484-1215(+)